MHQHLIATAGNGAGDTIGGIILWLIVIAAYWTPLLIARMRRVRNIGSVAVINGLLGWTVIGWIVALAMACRSADIPAREHPVA
jgi:hypothetical protein